VGLGEQGRVDGRSMAVPTGVAVASDPGCRDAGTRIELDGDFGGQAGRGLEHLAAGPERRVEDAGVGVSRDSSRSQCRDTRLRAARARPTTLSRMDVLSADNSVGTGGANDRAVSGVRGDPGELVQGQATS